MARLKSSFSDSLSLRFASLAIVVLVASVTVSPVPAAFQLRSMAASSTAAKQATEVDLFLEIAKVEPSFGGAFVTKDGTLAVWVVGGDSDAATTAKDAMVDFGLPDVQTKATQTLPASYSYQTV